MLEQLITWWTRMATRDPWGAALVLVYGALVACLTPVVVLGVVGAIRDWRARRIGRRHIDAAYRQYRGVSLQTSDGRLVGRLVGRSATRRAEVAQRIDRGLENRP